MKVSPQVTEAAAKLLHWKAEQRAKGADSFQIERIDETDTYKVYAFNGGKLVNTLEVRGLKVE